MKLQVRVITVSWQYMSEYMQHAVTSGGHIALSWQHLSEYMQQEVINTCFVLLNQCDIELHQVHLIQ